MAISRTLLPILLTSLVLAGWAERLRAAPPSLLRIFGKTPEARAAAQDPRKLTEVDGPWMILAASFAGPDGRSQAESLADELQRDLGISAFIHEENFDFTGKIDRPGTEGRVVRYANQSRYQAFAVLVGEYDSVDHPQLVRDLKRIKSAHPKVFETDAAESEADASAETPLDAVRNLQRSLLKRVGKTTSGPMSNAFATTNPLLPEEYFLIPEVDSFVMGLNSDVEHSLLDNPGKFTVVVATFAGFAAIADGNPKRSFEPSSERMDTCAINADKMARELRKKGVEAYQFHDRTRSLVTIGSFDHLGDARPGGDFEYAPGIRQVMAEYRAGGDPKPSRFGPVILAKHVASLPFDVNPTPIAVPRKSKRSLYSGRVGMK